jgi:SAM-dependent methyltransferase
MTFSIGTAALAAIKRQARATWSAGDYDAIATGIWSVGASLVGAIGVHPGDEVLDVACGTGNAAVPAAAAGGSVTGLDLTPELFPAARRRAAEASVDLELVEGDMEEMPFADGAFDVVLSTFGVMFAPRPEVAARELVRVLRPGGRIGLASWTPEGTVGNLFAVMARHLPAPQDGEVSPLLWGTERHVGELFAGAGIEIELVRERVPLKPDVDVARAVAFYLDKFGPLVAAREFLESQGGWAASEPEISEAVATMNADPPEYLVVAGTRQG